jgi:hypothetical protein
METTNSLKILVVRKDLKMTPIPLKLSIEMTFYMSMYDASIATAYFST